MDDCRNEEEELDAIKRRLERDHAEWLAYLRLTWMDDLLDNLKQAMDYIGDGETARATKHVVDAYDIMSKAQANRFWCEDCWEKNYGEVESADA